MARKIVTAVVKKPFKFVVHFMTGKAEEYTIEAESRYAAYLALEDKLRDADDIEKIDYMC